MIRLHCHRCGNDWDSHVENPARCSTCKTETWNRPLAELPIIPGVELRLIPGRDGYAAGSDGSVWTSRSKNGRGTHGLAWRPLKALMHPDWDYRKVGTGRTADGKIKLENISKLVLLAFRGQCPDGMECAHDNGNSFDDRIDNLFYKSPTSNWNDKRRHGTAVQGENHDRAVLSDADVLEMRRLYVEGVRKYQLASKFNVSWSNVDSIVRGLTWKHLLPGYIAAVQDETVSQLGARYGIR